MDQSGNYIEKNRALWNERTLHHIGSAFYDMENFMKGANSLNEIELSLLGDVSGKTVLHLQCHFGQDSISLARLGATVTGVDLSETAIDKARQIAGELDIPVRFICCNIYDLPEMLDEEFDIVFTSYGTIGWLPNLNKWGALVSRYLKPGGKFVFAEFHPVVWMFDNDFKRIQFSYFKKEPIIEKEEGTYADPGAAISLESVTWNHSISEVFEALVNNGLRVGQLLEYDYSPYNCLKNMVSTGEKKFQLRDYGDKLPLVYSIAATKS